MQIKYFVRTTLDRKLDDSYSQIEYELLIDYEHKPLKSLISQYEYISNYDCVLLEDDLILCKDFKNRIEKVIQEHPNDIINFFYNPNDYFMTKYEQRAAFSQCRYYPKGITSKIVEQLKTFDFLNATKTAPYVTRSIRKLDMNILHYRPCLVQHIDIDTLVGNCVGIKRTPYFIDYLDELGITYEEANTHKEELINLMKEKFKDIDKN